MLYCMSISHNSRKVCTDISKAIKTVLEESTKFTLSFGTDQYRPRSNCLLKSSLWVICQYRYNRDTASHRNSTNVLELGSLYLGMQLVLKMCQCIFFLFVSIKISVQWLSPISTKLYLPFCLWKLWTANNLQLLCSYGGLPSCLLTSWRHKWNQQEDTWL